MTMKRLFCHLFGHQRTPVVFSVRRIYCRRCGLDL
jgi:hypothetical protein